MTRNLIIILFLFATNVFGQTNNFELINSTGHRIIISEIRYNKDSTKFFSGGGKGPGFCKELKGKPCAITSQTNIYDIYIRVDIIAIDDSTRDTLFVKSFNNAQIHTLPFIINITSGEINKLPADFKTPPYLLFDTDKQRKTFKVNDTIEIKLINRDKVSGVIKAYDKNKIIIEDKNSKQITISRKDIDGVKLCGSVFAVGPRVAIPECHYSDVSKVKYKVVRQVLVTKNDGTMRYDWKE